MTSTEEDMDNIVDVSSDDSDEEGGPIEEYSDSEAEDILSYSNESIRVTHHLADPGLG